MHAIAEQVWYRVPVAIMNGSSQCFGSGYTLDSDLHSIGFLIQIRIRKADTDPGG
jgi:hypothetical protein